MVCAELEFKGTGGLNHGNIWAANGPSGRRYVIALNPEKFLWRVYIDNVPVRGAGLGVATFEVFHAAAQFCQEQEASQ